jgi:hypothetical protein
MLKKYFILANNILAAAVASIVWIIPKYVSEYINALHLVGVQAFFVMFGEGFVIFFIFNRKLFEWDSNKYARYAMISLICIVLTIIWFVVFIIVGLILHPPT